MPTITDVHATEIKDSRGNPTINVEMRSGDFVVRASVPSGKSAGSKEAHELRDADGVGVQSAIERVNGVIRSVILGAPIDYKAIDERLRSLDATTNKSHLGGNAMLGVSIATLRLQSATQNIPLWKSVAHEVGATPSFPRLYMNMLNGGAHAAFRLPFQEYIVSVGGTGPHDSYKKASRIFHALGMLLKKRYGVVPLGDEGGYAPALVGIDTPFQLLKEAIGADSDAVIAIDAAASEFFRDGVYFIEEIPLDSETMRHIYERLVATYPLKSIEDPFDEDDLSAFETMTKSMGERVTIVGDDLTVTNPDITKIMIDNSRANALIVKPNQVGTLSEVFETVRRAKSAGWKCIASHRSGETEDDFISDLAVGIGAYGIKAGAPTQLVRRRKYERLLAIEKEFGV
jgi:enolase